MGPSSCINSRRAGGLQRKLQRTRRGELFNTLGFQMRQACVVIPASNGHKRDVMSVARSSFLVWPIAFVMQKNSYATKQCDATLSSLPVHVSLRSNERSRFSSFTMGKARWLVTAIQQGPNVHRRWESPAPCVRWIFFVPLLNSASFGLRVAFYFGGGSRNKSECALCLYLDAQCDSPAIEVATRAFDRLHSSLSRKRSIRVC